LEIEVEAWYNSLPPLIKFDGNFSVDEFPEYGPLAPLVADPIAFCEPLMLQPKLRSIGLHLTLS
jgi:hypothetical protein